jgi:hypothetical protein
LLWGVGKGGEAQRSSTIGSIGEAVHVGRMGERNLMRRRVAMLIMAATVGTTMVAGPVGAAFGAEHHPPKFHPKDQPCSGGSNHPNCPGKH